MNKLFKKVQTKLERRLSDFPGLNNQPSSSSSSSHNTSIPVIPISQTPSTREIYRLRKQRGVNLGSWFTLENWLTPSLFTRAANSKSSEMDILEGMSSDLASAKSMLNNHWASFINEGDWQWMASHGINTVRIPVSYYHFLPSHPDPSVRALMAHTEFARFESVYTDAWGYFRNAIQTAQKYHIGVLVDLHAAPGAQNTDAHSGLSGGHAGLWDSREKQKLTIEILVALAKEIVGYPNVVGLEVLNEPKNSNMLQGFYDSAINAIVVQAGIHTMDLPIYISDSWEIGWYSQYVEHRANEGKFVALDHHLYRCFTQQDQSKSASDHAKDVHPSSQPPGGSSSMLSNASNKTGSALVIGEWSAALNPASLRHYGSEEAKRTAQAEWGHAQWEAYERFCAGWFFWTLKKEGGKDKGWGFYSAVEEGVLPGYVDRMKGAYERNKGNLDLEGLRAQGVAEGEGAYESHVGWWDNNSSASAKGKFEHWRFKEGYEKGWEDALAFWFGGESGELGGSELGFVGWWKRVRVEGHRRERGHSGMVWEFEHGYEQGIRKFGEVMKGI
ncbi:glycoside hydrolase [Dendrothele bispora CBS 962.96]|uniref:Glycoside hydrolase n=1 Tax=Dendrothele bispora (strain CBS 962.96) TaxID=1314807 RepID=A0A4S8L018_DENBC|nr:glycoside hydrolase [Dendrothele bispora CBS 962.96]